MIFKAFSETINKLLLLPETGIGYQVIDAKKINQSGFERYIVYNGQIIVNFNDVPTSRAKLFSDSFSTVLSKTDNSILLETNTISLVTKMQILEQRPVSNAKVFSAYRSSDNKKGAKDNPKLSCSGTDTYVRISAFEDDFRIDTVTRRLKSGSYTTTHRDYLFCVNSNDDPVDRYALPNDEVIKWAFYITPQVKDLVQIGVVQPAYGHDGGGLEAYFENGTSNGTYLYRRIYGQ